MWRRSVQARLRLLQGRWREAEQDALAVLAVGDVPLGRLRSHRVLGLLAARREAPVENLHLDELWRLATKLDVAGLLAPVVAALTEPARITRRPDPRLDGSLVTALAGLPGTGLRAASPVGATARRRRRPALFGAHTLPAPDQLPEQQPRAGARTVGRRVSPASCLPRSPCWTSWTPVPSPRWRAGDCASSG